MAGTRPRRGADVVVRALEALGVRTVFSLSGNHIMPIYDALTGSSVELIHVRHEAACVHLADAYARLTGELGVALVTGGQGHSNACAALLVAQATEAPVLLLSGHAATDELGRGAFQELAQAALAAPVTKAAWTAAPDDDLGDLLARAARQARSGRRGPVQVSLPFDLLQRTAAGEEASAAVSIVAPDAAPTLPPPQMAALQQVLAEAERPLILCGPGQCDPSGRVAMQRLQSRLGIPVLPMESPRGSNDPSLGALADVLAAADCIVLLGKPLDFTLRFGQAPTIAAAARFVVVEPDGVSAPRVCRLGVERLALSVEATAADALAALLEAAAPAPPGAGDRPGWLAWVEAAIAYRPPEWTSLRASRSAPLHPLALGAALQRFIDRHPNALFVSDGGEIGQWAQAAVTAPARLINGVAGSIGPGLPFALAACVARRGDASAGPVVALMGDGTVGFHIAEFDTAVRYGLPVIVVVGNDARWNAEYQIQRRDYGAARARHCELLPTRYDQVAAGFGAHGEHVTDPEQLDAALERAWQSGKPACLNVMIESLPAPLIRLPVAAPP